MFAELEHRFAAQEARMDELLDRYSELVGDVDRLERELRRTLGEIVRARPEGGFPPVVWCDGTRPRHDWAPVAPVQSPRGGRPVLYPWDRVEVGRGFFVRCDAEERLSYFRAQASKRGRALGRGFTVRAIADGIEIWRVT